MCVYGLDKAVDEMPFPGYIELSNYKSESECKSPEAVIYML